MSKHHTSRGAIYGGRRAGCRRAYSYLELLVVIGIILIIVATGFTMRAGILPDSALSTQTRQVMEIIKLAQIRALNRDQNSAWGVRFTDNVGSSDQYILFKGSSYAARDTAYDLTTTMASTVTLGNITFTGGQPEVVFAQLTGVTSNTGSLTITSIENDVSTITVTARGVVEVD